MSGIMHPGSPMGDSSGSGSPARPHSHRAQHIHSRSRGREIGLLSAKVIACALSAVLLVGFGYGWYEYRSLNNGLQRFHLSHLAGAGTNSKSGNKKVNGTEQNILIVGVDSRSGLSASERNLLSVGNANSLSTDTIMVIHVPADGSKATMISIPRDSYVDIPGGYLKNKINAAYADAYTATAGTNSQKQAAGANELVATVSKLTGLSINHYIQVGFGGFYTIAKAIGGISVDLCQSTDDTLAHNEATGLGRVGSNFKMSAGKHNLTPVQVVEFVRQRHNLQGGDLAREKRQRYFLTEAFKKIESAGTLLNPVKLSNLINAIAGTFYIDDNAGFSIPDLAAQMADLSANNITGYTIPTEGDGTATIGTSSESVVLVNPARVQARIVQILSSATPVKKPAPGSSTSASTSARASTSAPQDGSPINTTTPPKPTAGCIN